MNGDAGVDTIAWARPDDVGMSRERLLRIGEVLEADIGRGLLPGAVALVARRGKVVHFKAYGQRAPGFGDPMALDTLFRIYSMTKPIVSTAAMMLAEAGRITLDDPVSAFIPAFADAKVARVVAGRIEELVPPRRPATIQDLLRHTSGITYEWMDDGPIEQLYDGAGLGRRDRTNADQADALAGLPFASQPGTRWDYSRSTDILGRVIEIVSGQTLGQHLDEAVLGPLGMMETGFAVPNAFQDRLAEAFPLDPESGEVVTLMDVSSAPAFESGGGGLVSTAADYARFLHMLASGGTLEGTRLLSPAALAFMMSDHLESDVAIGSDLLPPGYGFGLGFAVRRTRGLAPFPGSVGDAYWGGLAGTAFWVDPAEQLYALLMVQAPGRRDHYRRVFRHLVYGAITETCAAH